MNNDQVAIAIDADAGSSGRIEDEEDEKGNIFCVFCVSFSFHRIRLLKIFPELNNFLLTMSLFSSVHGFKSLTTSRFIPRFTRPVSDMIDGLW